VDKTERLLDIVRRGSETDFNTFIECLRRTGQGHVSGILQEDGTVAHIVARMSSEADNLEEDERYIVDNIMAYYKMRHARTIDAIANNK